MISFLKRIPYGTIAVLVRVIVLCCGGLYWFLGWRKLDFDSADWTKRDLIRLVDGALIIPYEDLNRIETIDQYLEELEKHKWMGRATSYRNDRWHTPLAWKIERRPALIMIISIYAGWNKKLED